MSLPINIEDLLHRNKVESNRVEFKKGWNPASIYHTICAFANDLDNLGGGYIIVGVEEENGMPKRPVAGVPTEQLDKIQLQMVGFNNLFAPYYLPRISVEEVDGRNLVVIWAPTGVNRPYSIRMDVTNGNDKREAFIYVLVRVVLLLKVRYSMNCGIWQAVCLLMGVAILISKKRILIMY